MKVKVKVKNGASRDKKVQDVPISTEFIKLDSFLKFCSIAQTGGEAKIMVEFGEVKVNGETVYQRGRKLRSGDTVEAGGLLFKIAGGTDVH